MKSLKNRKLGNTEMLNSRWIILKLGKIQTNGGLCYILKYLHLKYCNSDMFRPFVVHLQGRASIFVLKVDYQ
jgi:hypothetical protein